MTLLRRTLKVQAALWALFGLACLVVPTTVTDVVAGPTTGGVDAIVRVLGVTALTLAMLMVLVAQHPGETWWWAWAFVVLEVGVATVCMLHAVVGVGEDGSALPWWILGVASAVFGGLDLVALTRAEQTKPFA